MLYCLKSYASDPLVSFAGFCEYTSQRPPPLTTRAPLPPLLVNDVPVASVTLPPLLPVMDELELIVIAPPVRSCRLAMPVLARLTLPPTVSAPDARLEFVLPTTSVPAVMLLSFAWVSASVPDPLPMPIVVVAVFGRMVTV